MLRSIRVSSLKELQRKSLCASTAVLSISDPAGFQLTLNAAWRCHVEMLDLEPGDLLKLNMPEDCLPEHSEVLKAAAFIKLVIDAREPIDLLIQCNLGQSRSAAFALVASEVSGVPVVGDLSKANSYIYAMVQEAFMTKCLENKLSYTDNDCFN